MAPNFKSGSWGTWGAVEREQTRRGASADEAQEQETSMDEVETAVCAGSFVAHHCLFRILYAFDKNGKKKRATEASEDAQKLYSCYLSHIHCLVTIVSCLSYWYQRPVDVLSPKFMVEVASRLKCHEAVHAPAAAQKHPDTLTRALDVRTVYLPLQGPTSKRDDEWMRRTVSFSVGYFANDLLLMQMYPCIGGSDMIAHHIIIGGFFVLGLFDRSHLLEIVHSQSRASLFLVHTRTLEARASARRASLDTKRVWGADAHARACISTGAALRIISCS
jgi:hypothetical protein